MSTNFDVPVDEFRLLMEHEQSGGRFVIVAECITLGETTYIGPLPLIAAMREAGIAAWKADSTPDGAAFIFTVRPLHAGVVT